MDNILTLWQKRWWMISGRGAKEAVELFRTLSAIDTTFVMTAMQLVDPGIWGNKGW
jgi:hypothetical protein